MYLFVSITNDIIILINLFIYSQTSDNNFKLSPEPTRVEEFKRATSKSTYAVYEINQYAHNGRVLHLEAKYINAMSHYTEPTPPILYAQRFQTGSGSHFVWIMRECVGIKLFAKYLLTPTALTEDRGSENESFCKFFFQSFSLVDFFSI